jgi:hypothetical protein
LCFEGAVEDGGEQRVQLGGGLGLQALQPVHLPAKCIETQLFGVFRHGNPRATEDITRLPPAQLAESILDKGRRIADIIGNIKGLLARTK